MLSIDGELYLVLSNRLGVLVARKLVGKARAFAEKELDDAEWNVEALLVGNDPEFDAR